MSFQDSLSGLRESILNRVQQLVYSIARFTYVTKSSASGETDGVEGHPTGPDEPQGQDDVRRLGGGGWGVNAVPPKGEPCLVVRAGGGSMNGVIVACGSKRYMPSLNDGETCLYNKISGVQVKLASDGSVSITDQSGNSITVDGTSTINVVAGTVNLGSAAAGDFIIKGTSFRAGHLAFDTQLTLVATALTLASADPVLGALCPVASTQLATAGSTLTAAVTNFETAAVAAMSSKVKTA